MPNRQYIHLWRKIRDSDLWTAEPMSKGQAWVDLCLLASPTDTTDCKRGDVLTTDRQLAKRWQWSRGKARYFLEALERDEQIETIAGGFRIVNYAAYNETPKPEQDTTAASKPEPEQLELIADPLPDFPDVKKQPFPKSARRKPKGEQKRMRVDYNTPMMKRIGSWFGRRDGTLWTVYEAISLEQVDPPPSEIEEMEAFYKATDILEPGRVRRHSIETMLNNWAGELDKARKYAKGEYRPSFVDRKGNDYSEFMSQ